MKKIIGIILAVLMMFSMSTMAFAGTETYTPATDDGPDYVVTIDIAGPTMEHEETDKGTKDYKCYEFTVEVINNTKTAIEATEFDVYVKAYNSETKTEYDILFDDSNVDFSKAEAQSGGGKGSYTIPAKVNTNANLYFEIAVNTEEPVTVKTFTDKVEAEFPMVVTEDIVPPADESEDEVIEDEIIEDEVIEDEPVVDEPVDEFEEEEATGGDEEWIEEEIPNTGSTSTVGAFAVLGLAAAALILTKKRKSNEENWT